METYQYVPSVVDLRIAVISIEVFIVIMYLGLHVKCPIVCLILNKFVVSGQIFVRVFSIKFHENPSSGSRADRCRQTDWRTDVTKLFASYTNTPKNAADMPGRNLAL